MRVSRNALAAVGLLLATTVRGGPVVGAAPAPPWRPAAAGLEAQTVVGGPEHPDWPPLVHLLRLDPARHRLRVVIAGPRVPAGDAPPPGPGPVGLTVEELAASPRTLAAMNGGFFDAQGRALGWLVTDGCELSPPARRGWGALWVDGVGRAAVVAAAAAPQGQAQQALQAGPRLVVAGRVNTLKPQQAVRSFVGIDAKGRIVLGSTSPLPADATALARFLAAPEAEGGVALVDALNLDGGSSAQFFARGALPDGGDLLRPGFARVPNALVVEALPEPPLAASPTPP